jgi:putative acetyltransferase
VRIRPETPDDHEAVSAVHRAAFRDDRIAALPAAARAAGDYVPELSLVAVDDQEIVGHVLLSYCRLETEQGCRRVLQLSPIGVVPRRQREGIGSLLIREAIRRADELGEPLVLLVGDPRYYSRFGFRTASRLGIEHPTPVRDDVFMALPLKAYDVALRGRLVYPAAWAELTQ